MRRAAILLFAALLAACGSAPRRDLDFDRLHASLQALATAPQLAKLALAERALAEAAVRRLDASSINAKEHAQLSYLAERRVDIAYIAAQTEQEKARLTQLQREHAELLLAASRRETEAVRAELDRQRRHDLLQQEEIERDAAASAAPHGGTNVTAAAKPAPPAAAPAAVPPPTLQPAAPPEAAAPGTADTATTVAAAPAAAPGGPPETAAEQPVMPAPAAPSAVAEDAPLAERLAALAPDADGGGRRVTLEDLIFEPGTATFAGGADIGLARVAAWLAAAPALPIRIEGHTDATGSPEANLSLSLRRAEAVRDALVARGVAAARIVVSGEGGADPVASNDDAAGRARNRRVVVELLDGG